MLSPSSPWKPVSSMHVLHVFKERDVDQCPYLLYTNCCSHYLPWNCLPPRSGEIKRAIIKTCMLLWKQSISSVMFFCSVPSRLNNWKTSVTWNTLIFSSTLATCCMCMKIATKCEYSLKFYVKFFWLDSAHNMQVVYTPLEMISCLYVLTY